MLRLRCRTRCGFGAPLHRRHRRHLWSGFRPEVEPSGDSVALAPAGAQEIDEGGAASGEVIVDGSSTVQPLTAAAGELFAYSAPGIAFTEWFLAGTPGGERSMEAFVPPM